MFSQRTHSSSQSTRRTSSQSSQTLHCLHTSQTTETFHNLETNFKIIEVDIVQRLQFITIIDLNDPEYEEVLPRCPEIVQKQGRHVQQDRRRRSSHSDDLREVEPVGSSLSEGDRPPLPLKKRKICTSPSTTTTTTRPSLPIRLWRLKSRRDDSPDSTTTLRIAPELQ